MACVASRPVEPESARRRSREHGCSPAGTAALSPAAEGQACSPAGTTAFSPGLQSWVCEVTNEKSRRDDREGETMAHTYGKCLYHFVFSTRERRESIQAAVSATLVLGAAMLVAGYIRRRWRQRPISIQNRVV
jgi:hypothetical protein